jgi:hypothetical protein
MYNSNDYEAALVLPPNLKSFRHHCLKQKENAFNLHSAEVKLCIQSISVRLSELSALNEVTSKHKETEVCA